MVTIEKFSDKISKIMATGVVCYVCDAVVFLEPLFCRCMSLLGEGEMDGEVVEANNLTAYFLEDKSETLNRWGWHLRFLMDIVFFCGLKNNKSTR